MIDICRIPDQVKILCEGEITDAQVRFFLGERQLHISLQADRDEPKFVCLRWVYTTDEPVRVLGDRWERSYADLAWLPLDTERFMPWYFMVNNGSTTVGCGVQVQPNSFVSFQYDAGGVSAWFDVRCGAKGVRLNGRELEIGTVVCESYSGISSFEATRRFCRVMCTAPLLPREPVYGSNNWYYAYGTSRAQDILRDTELVLQLADGNAVRPYMVIDSCWETNNYQNRGPWMPNERFPDMAQLAAAMKEKGVRPGLWFRPLYDKDFSEQHPDCCMERNRNFADPSHPETQEYLRTTLRRFRDWGFTLIKHDFTTVDMFGNYGLKLNGAITAEDNWAFYDRSKTGAEIVLDLYRLILEETPGMVHISCNTVSHLCAGLTELNRIGDDTSGTSWSRTMVMGVNTLAFRLPQNGAFYCTDADVTAIYEKHIPWELNKQWATLLSQSGTPFFASCQPEMVDEEKKKVLREAFRRAAVQTDRAVPLDWEYNKLPCRWDINGTVTEFNWTKDFIPELIPGMDRPY